MSIVVVGDNPVFTADALANSKGLREGRDGFRYGFLLLCFPCEREIERDGQVACSFVGCQAMDSAPKVKHVTGCSARWVEALEGVLAQVNGERASASAFGSMNWTGATTLRSTAS